MIVVFLNVGQEGAVFTNLQGYVGGQEKLLLHLHYAEVEVRSHYNLVLANEIITNAFFAVLHAFIDHWAYQPFYHLLAACFPHELLEL